MWKFETDDGPDFILEPEDDADLDTAIELMEKVWRVQARSIVIKTCCDEIEFACHGNDLTD